MWGSRIPQAGGQRIAHSILYSGRVSHEGDLAFPPPPSKLSPPKFLISMDVVLTQQNPLVKLYRLGLSLSSKCVKIPQDSPRSNLTASYFSEGACILHHSCPPPNLKILYETLSGVHDTHPRQEADNWRLVPSNH